MKKKILLFVLAFAMIFTSLVSVAHAEEEGDGDTTLTCQGLQNVNIAPESTLGGTNMWIVSGHDGISNFKLLVDGDKGTGAGSVHNGTDCKRTYTFDEAKTLTGVSVWVNQTPNNAYALSGDSGLTNAYMKDTENATITQNFNVVVSYYREDGSKIHQESINTSGLYELVYDLTAVTEPVKSVEVYTWCGYNNGLILFEVEIFSRQMVHAWTLDEVTTAPTCTVEGEGNYVCDCGATKTDVIAATGHNPDGNWKIEAGVPAVEDDPATEEDETAAAIPEKHYQGCLNENCTDKLDLAEHSYSSACDIRCNVCSAERTNTSDHNYSLGDCQEDCAACGEKRTAPVAHTYVHGCDTDCEVCFEERETEHVYTDCEDEECDSQNADGTIKCDGTRTAPGHTWDNACDNECNACGAANPDYEEGHVWDNCDDTVCNECEFARTAVAHIYDNCDDTGCNTCGMTRTAVAHVYDNACDGTCNNCTVTRTPADHVYDNACDATCNVCSAARTPAAHVYDNDCDKTCNVCSAERTVADHVYGEEFEESEAGTKVYTCSICGYKNDSGEKTGLGGGAIAGIVIGSVAVVGGGGFAAWWFIFKKKAI